MASLEDIVREAMIRAGRTPGGGGDSSNNEPGGTDSQGDAAQSNDETSDQQETDKLILQCVFEVVQMQCYTIKRLGDIRRTIKNVLKALVKENDYVTLGVIKRYVDPRNRALVKSILNRAIDTGLVISTSVEDVVLYQINHIHAETVFNYLERVK